MTISLFVLRLCSSLSILEPALVKILPYKKPQLHSTLPVEDDLPGAITWSPFKICEWVRALGFPQYVVSIYLFIYTII